jgi:hypothetical protein
MTWVCDCGRVLVERDGLLLCVQHGVRTRGHEFRWRTLGNVTGDLA